MQRGGFRSFTKKKALSLGVTGYAENLSMGEVIIVAEGGSGELEELVAAVEEEAPVYIEVENVEKRREEYRGTFDDFERKGRDVVEGLEEEGTRDILLRMASTSRSTDEKLGKGIEYLSDIKDDTSAIKSDTSAIKEDTSTILEKQDETIQTIREESEKTRETVSEESTKTREELSSTVREESGKTRETIEEGFGEQREAHVETRELSREVFYAEVEELRNEIKDLRSALDEVRSEIGLA